MRSGSPTSCSARGTRPRRARAASVLGVAHGPRPRYQSAGGWWRRSRPAGAARVSLGRDGVVDRTGVGLRWWPGPSCRRCGGGACGGCRGSVPTTPTSGRGRPRTVAGGPAVALVVAARDEAGTPQAAAALTAAARSWRALELPDLEIVVVDDRSSDAHRRPPARDAGRRPAGPAAARRPAARGLAGQGPRPATWASAPRGRRGWCSPTPTSGCIRGPCRWRCAPRSAGARTTSRCCRASSRAAGRCARSWWGSRCCSRCWCVPGRRRIRARRARWGWAPSASTVAARWSGPAVSRPCGPGPMTTSRWRRP